MIQKVSVLGLGKSGQAAADLAADLGREVFVSEEKETTPDDIKNLRERGVEFEFGGHSERVLLSDLIVISPGVRFDHPILVGARKKGIEVISEIEFAFRHMRPSTIIAITGTNGKTTTTQLVYEILKADKRKAVACGNIGYPLSEVARTAEEGSFVVAEISSFQLEGIRGFRPKVGVLLNITPDHLDRHRDLRIYQEAKSRIFENQEGNDFMILNRDDPLTVEAGKGKRARYIPFSRKRELDEGIFVSGDRIGYRLAGFGEGKIISWQDLKLPGFHNLENVLASIAVGLVLGVNIERLRETLLSFPGLPHRIEYLGQVNGITFINDSKATNVDATLRALESLKGDIILIAGGKDKGNDYRPLRPMIEGKVKTLILIGETKEKIAAQVGNGIKTCILSDLEEAVNVAYSLAKAGDSVLLSPASSSLDQFRNFEERGSLFKEYVERLRGLERRKP